MHNIWYNSFIGDGNSSAYATVDKSIPYCPVVFIQKEECVNHATKRISNNLRRFVNEYKGKKLEDGKEIGGKRTLTNARSTLQKTFMESNSRGTGILVHYSSSIEKPLRNDCPKGPKSWCNYQRDKTLARSTYVPLKHPLTEAVVKVLTSLSIALAVRVFLRGVKMHQTRMPMNHSIKFCGLIVRRSILILLRQRLLLYNFVCIFMVLSTHLIRVRKGSGAVWIK